MPNIGDIVIVNVTTAVSFPPGREWGVPAVVGDATLGAFNEPTLVKSKKAAELAFGSGSDLVDSFASFFKQGIRKAYGVRVSGSDATAYETALTSLGTLSEQGKVNGVVASKKYESDVAILEKLKSAAEMQKLIFAVTNDVFASVSDMKTLATSLGSKNGFFLAHIDDDVGDEDVAASGMGVMMSYKPWISPYLKSINSNVSKYFSKEQVEELESHTQGINCIIDLVGRRISHGLSLDAVDPFIDIRRTCFWLEQGIKDAVLGLRIRADKLPYTPAGIAAVKVAITTFLDVAVGVGALREYSVSPDGIALPSYVVIMPVYADIPVNDKAARVLKNIEIVCYLAGDIFTFEIDLEVTV